MAGGKGDKSPVDTYFVDTNSLPLIQSGAKDFSSKLHYLGSHGIVDLCGLKVAFLSGSYDKESFEKEDTVFVKTHYTRLAIEQLKRQVEVSGACDFLLTGEWPLGWDNDITDVLEEKPTILSPVIAELAASIEPRYIACGANDLFYARPPFQTLVKGHVCRFIGLGTVGSKGKHKKWLHALQVTPIDAMEDDALKQRPENTTPCPFRTRKRPLDTEQKEAAVIPESEEIFLTNLHPGITDNSLRKALSQCGDLVRLHLVREGDQCKGFGWATFRSIEEARKAVKMNEALENGGKKIRIAFNKHRREVKKRCPSIVVEPHADCWFCLANPKVQKHLILNIKNPVYITMAKGGINEDHLLILPVKHAPSYAACPLDIQNTIERMIEVIRKMYRKQNKEILVWERWIPMKITQANHMQIQIVAVEPSLVDGHGFRVLEAASRRVLNNSPILSLNALENIPEHVTESQTPYCYFEMVGDNTAMGRKVERYLITGPGRPFPMNFCREIAAELLDVPDRVDWRKCQLEEDEEKMLAHTLRVKLKEFL